jgi:hypothetical protein
MSLVLLAPGAYAISIFCPELDGTYLCQSRKGNVKVRILQDDVWFDARYLFQIQGQPDQVFISNNERVPVPRQMGSGLFSARCSDDRLLVTWSVRDRSGRDLQFRDSIYIEGNSLVTVRTPRGPASRDLADSRVCRRL